jgi:mannonate dehydratase
MKQTWRWFGPKDPITLKQIAQAGASGIVTSLHHIATGEAWSCADVDLRKTEIEQAGLEWTVVESIPLHNDIKLRKGNFQQLIENYKTSIKAVAQAGVKVVCYNFMPVVDWTRTSLSFKMENQAQALGFDMTDFAAYDIHTLLRENAETDYSQEIVQKAKIRYQEMTEEQIALLEKNIIAGLPGGEGSHSREGIRLAIAEFVALGTEVYRNNLVLFLQDIIPVAEEMGVRMCIHPDDPPFSLFGLPRVVSTSEDVSALLNSVPSPSNGLTLCLGSFGVRADNNLVAMTKQFAPNIHFVHLRNIKRQSDGSFHESDHLDGDNDIVGVIKALLDEQKKRVQEGRLDSEIPMRPDHGHLMDAEASLVAANPGYSYLGRLKGLAELRGVICGLTFAAASSN